MLFHLEKWFDVPSNVHFPLSLQFPINVEAVNDNNLSIQSTAVPQPRASAPSVMSEENRRCVNVVNHKLDP